MYKTNITKQGTALGSSSSSSLVTIVSYNSTLRDDASFYPSLLHREFWLHHNILFYNIGNISQNNWFFSRSILDYVYSIACSTWGFSEWLNNAGWVGWGVFVVFLVCSLHAFITSELGRLNNWIEKHSATERYIISKCSSKQSQGFF